MLQMQSCRRCPMPTQPPLPAIPAAVADGNASQAWRDSCLRTPAPPPIEPSCATCLRRHRFCSCMSLAAGDWWAPSMWLTAVQFRPPPALPGASQLRLVPMPAKPGLCRVLVTGCSVSHDLFVSHTCHEACASIRVLRTLCSSIIPRNIDADKP